VVLSAEFIPASADSLLSEFSERAADLGVVVERVADSDEAAARIRRFGTELDVERVAVSAELIAAAPSLKLGLDRRNLAAEVPDDAARVREAPFGASLGLAGIAETGSILLAEASLPDRAIGMLVAVQVIVCRTATLVPSLDQAAALLRALAARPGGAYATLVTGPSRTADIERVLTVGVQGPARLIVLFVDELS